MAFGSSGSGSLRNDINVTPLVDVVLVLLIIFMVMSPQSLKLHKLVVPEKSTEEVTVPNPNQQLIVAVASDGTVRVNGESIPEDRLAIRLRERLSVRAEKMVFFDFHPEATYGDAIHVVDITRGAGAQVLGLMTP